MSVYVAGSSDELDRARRVMDMYRAAGVEVTSTWVENITAVGAANPRHASREERQGHAYGCIDQVRAADVLHWLAPAVGHGRGSYWEAALAWVWSKQIIASGDTKQSIFPALVREVATDDDAVAQIVDAHRRAGKAAGDTWSKAIAASPNAATPITGPVLCTCAECVDNRANAARLGYAVAPATFHAVEPEPAPRDFLAYPVPPPCDRFVDKGDGYCSACHWGPRFHAVEHEPAVARTTTPQVDALLGAIVDAKTGGGE